MKIDTDEGADELTLNLTPMIDVIFQLLIFFMVATAFLDPERELEVELPEASSGQVVDEPLDEIVINVMRDGRLLVSGEEVREGALPALLAHAAQRDPETPVTIRGDRLVHHERVVGVMDACGSAGLFNLAIGTLETP